MSIRFSPMLITTMNDLPGYDIEEVLGEVFGLDQAEDAKAWVVA